MNTPEKVWELQAQMSHCGGTKHIATWMIAFSIVLLAGGAFEAIRHHESFLGMVAIPLGLIAQSPQMRADAKRREQELERQLS